MCFGLFCVCRASFYVVRGGSCFAMALFAIVFVLTLVSKLREISYCGATDYMVAPADQKRTRARPEKTKGAGKRKETLIQAVLRLRGDRTRGRRVKKGKNKSFLNSKQVWRLLEKERRTCRIPSRCWRVSYRQVCRVVEEIRRRGCQRFEIPENVESTLPESQQYFFNRF